MKQIEVNDELDFNGSIATVTEINSESVTYKPICYPGPVTIDLATFLRLRKLNKVRRI